MNTNLTTALTEKTNFLLPTMVEGDFTQDELSGDMDGVRPLKKSQKEGKSGKIGAYQSKGAGVRYASGRRTAAVILQQPV